MQSSEEQEELRKILLETLEALDKRIQRIEWMESLGHGPSAPAGDSTPASRGDFRPLMATIIGSAVVLLVPLITLIVLIAGLSGDVGELKGNVQGIRRELASVSTSVQISQESSSNNSVALAELSAVLGEVVKDLDRMQSP